MTHHERAVNYIKSHPRENIATIQAMLLQSDAWFRHRAARYVRDYLFQPGPPDSPERYSFDAAVDTVEDMLREAAKK